MRPKFAKITRPVLRGVVQRARLLGKLDAAVHQYRVVWLGAPAGSGKTTLAASWLEARSPRCLWYQLDPRDADPSTFFYYLREGVHGLTPRRRETLPLLTPEYALGLDAYARNFFERVGVCLRRPTFLVLEDFQELPRQAPLQQLLPTAINALPDGFGVLVLSREPPSPPFARFFADGLLTVIDGAQLNLTRVETRALLRARGVKAPTSDAASALHTTTGGWLAGTVLLLETKAPTRAQVFSNDPCARQVVFDYFAAEVLGRAPPATQRFLLETAFLPQVSAASARALTGEEHSGEILLDLQRRDYFTLRLAGTEPRYHYHPLFRDFLISHARRTFPVDCLRNLVKRAATVLVQAGNAEDAVTVSVEQGNLDELTDLLVDLAPTLVRQGRLAQLAQWLSTVAPETLTRNPWLAYYFGVARSVCSPEQARSYFERAYQSFEAAGNTEGMLLAWAGCVDTFVYVWDAFAPLDRWISAMEKLRGQGLAFPSHRVEGHVVFGMLASLMWRRPEHPEMGYWLSRAACMIQTGVDPELRMHLATYLLFHCIWWSGDHARARVLLEQMRPLLAEPDLTPLTQLLWFVMEAAYDARIGDSSACFEAVERGLAFARATGILVLNQQLAIQGVYAGLAAGDLSAAATYHEKARQSLRPGERLNFAHYLHLGAWIAICSGDFVGARDSIRGAMGLVDASGAAMSQSWAELTLAYALIEADGTAEAVPLLERALSWGRTTSNPIIEHHCLLSLALARSREGLEVEAATWLREGLRIGRERQYTVHPWIGWRKGAMSELTALALEHQIEPQYVSDLIQARGLSPPRSAASVSAWPGATRIYTLGRFEIWRGEQRVRFSRKGPKRLVMFLQALIALADTEASDVQISDALWPDTDGDKAHHALETTVSRLRSLLGSKRAIVHCDGKLSLDPDCWTDVRAMQTLLARGRRALKGGPEGGCCDVRSHTERILELYRGKFLPDATEDQPGVVAMRMRLRSQLSEYLRAIDVHLGAASDGYLERARRADPDLL